MARTAERPKVLEIPVEKTDDDEASYAAHVKRRTVRRWNEHDAMLAAKWVEAERMTTGWTPPQAVAE